MGNDTPKQRYGMPPEQEISGTKAGEVQSLSRALSILEKLAQHYEGLTLTVLAKAVKLPPSTTHRLLTTLQRHRFVRFDPPTMFWQIGMQTFVVGNAFVRMRDVSMVARPHMRKLMEASGETANLYVPNRGEAICMAQIESHQMMRAISRTGGHVKMHCSAAGKAMLAHLPKAEVDRIVQLHGLPRATGKTLTSLKKLRTDLAAVRALGFAIDDEEHFIGLRCIAAPILDEANIPIAALSLSGPTARISNARLNNLGAAVVAAIHTMSGEIGWYLADQNRQDKSLNK